MNDYNVKLVKFFVREAGSDASYKNIETDALFDKDMDLKVTENIRLNSLKTIDYNINMKIFSNINKYNNTAIDVLVVEVPANRNVIEKGDTITLFENVLCEIKLKIEINTSTNAILSFLDNYFNPGTKLSWGEIK